MDCSNLIRGFLNLGNLDMANQLLEEFESKGFWAHVPWEYRIEAAVVRVPFIEYWLKQGNDEEAMRWYQSLITNDKFQVFGDTGNAILKLFLRYGKKTEAWELFHRMLDGFSEYHTTVNSETIEKMVKECFKEDRFKEANETFYKVRAKVKYLKRVDFRNVITRCCEQGMLSEAEVLFAHLSSDTCLPKDFSSYRVMIDAYVKAGRVDDAVQMANNMVYANLKFIGLWLIC